MTSFPVHAPALAYGVAVLALIAGQPASARGAATAAAQEASPAAAAQPGAQQSTSSAADTAGADIVVTAQRTRQCPAGTACGDSLLGSAARHASAARNGRSQRSHAHTSKNSTHNLRALTAHAHLLRNWSSPTPLSRSTSPIGNLMSMTFIILACSARRSVHSHRCRSHRGSARPAGNDLRAETQASAPSRSSSKAPPLQRVDLKADASFGTANEALDSLVDCRLARRSGQGRIRLSADHQKRRRVRDQHLQWREGAEGRHVRASRRGAGPARRFEPR